MSRGSAGTWLCLLCATVTCCVTHKPISGTYPFSPAQDGRGHRYCLVSFVMTFPGIKSTPTFSVYTTLLRASCQQGKWCSVKDCRPLDAATGFLARPLMIKCFKNIHAYFLPVKKFCLNVLGGMDTFMHDPAALNR